MLGCSAGSRSSFHVVIRCNIKVSYGPGPGPSEYIHVQESGVNEGGRRWHMPLTKVHNGGGGCIHPLRKGETMTLEP